ncbi:hypothetical protein [Variovorax guangxiensis]|uniref:hypothetical protein n=1 Tax=Variovorax guangxiensis TaxID=1775474 RepID=UPI0028561E80|nr:hypothetical protein [Variovorax guangxiensis]MDR6861305.1 hypothetical protein [Variovorax guangxiensis]
MRSTRAGEYFVNLSEGFLTYSGFMVRVMSEKTSTGVGYTLLPGRVRAVMPQKVQLIHCRPGT